MTEIDKIRMKPVSELTLLISECTSKQEILRRLGINIKNAQALKYLINFIASHEINISHHCMGNPLHKRYSKETIQQLANESICWTDLMKHMDIRFSGNNIQTVRKLIKHYKTDVSHFDARKAAAQNNSGTRSYDDIFCENSTALRPTVKSRILSLNLIPYKCSGPQCTITDTWNGQPIVLHLEHINGVGNDNRLDNLCFLCPNCHSQTSTYAGRNVQGKKRAVDGSFITTQEL